MTAPTPPMTDEEFNRAVRADPTAHTAYVEAIRARAEAADLGEDVVNLLKETSRLRAENTGLRKALEHARWRNHDHNAAGCDGCAGVESALEKNGGGK
jgi:hypothetical protein